MSASYCAEGFDSVYVGLELRCQCTQLTCSAFAGIAPHGQPSARAEECYGRTEKGIKCAVITAVEPVHADGRRDDMPSEKHRQRNHDEHSSDSDGYAIMR